jgi:hypothetical protein
MVIGIKVEYSRIRNMEMGVSMSILTLISMKVVLGEMSKMVMVKCHSLLHKLYTKENLKMILNMVNVLNISLEIRMDG